nr:hypothetical protein [Clostridia bacterium]
MPFFTHAKPIYIKGLSRELNAQAGFVCTVDADESKEYSLLIIGSTYYRVYLNGRVIHFGPARGPHGYMRCDTLPLKLRAGKNVIAAEVAGYNCTCYYAMNIPSFIQAEVKCESTVVACTGRDFKALSLTDVRVRKVIRYSFQRTFTEVWHLNNPKKNWTNGDFAPEETEVVYHGRALLDRGFALPYMGLTENATLTECGQYKPLGTAVHEGNRFLDPRPDDAGFKAAEIEDNVVDDTYADFTPDKTADPSSLTSGMYARHAFEHIYAGFIRTKLTAAEPSVVYVTFAESTADGRINCGHGENDTVNIIKYELDAGEYTLESFEPYSLKYVDVMVKTGKVSLESVNIRELAYPVAKPEIVTDNPMLKAAFDASFESFRHNTVDCFTDCPGRERAGWLCDSFFSAKASMMFTGTVECEKHFLDNFRLPERFPTMRPTDPLKLNTAPKSYLPQGLLPMCYPGENRTGNTIPQWTMWYVLELYEFKARGGDAKPHFKLLEKILNFFAGYENADGLLEKLPLWNFVEWSKANKWVKDINYPTNMLYYRVLNASAELLDRPELCEKAERVKNAVIAQSYDGRFFRDHALRGEDGTLKLCGDYSAICQHEAIYFGVVNENDPDWADFVKRVIEQDYSGEAYAELERLDLFPGLLVRTELLHRMGLYEMNLSEIAEMFGVRMAAVTGTLWEHRDGSGSRNHGISSSIACIIAEELEKLNKQCCLN